MMEISTIIKQALYEYPNLTDLIIIGGRPPILKTGIGQQRFHLLSSNPVDDASLSDFVTFLKQTYPSSTHIHYRDESTNSSWRITFDRTQGRIMLSMRRLPDHTENNIRDSYPKQVLESIENMLLEENMTPGLYVIWGGTGQGKSTLLYTLIQSIYTHGHPVILIEDIYEGILPNSPLLIRKEKSLDYNKTQELYSRILKTPIDYIALSEISTPEDTNFVIHASLSRHIVLSTIHAADYFSLVTRLLEESGVSTWTLAGILRAFIRVVLASDNRNRQVPLVEYVPVTGEIAQAIRERKFEEIEELVRRSQDAVSMDQLIIDYLKQEKIHPIWAERLVSDRLMLTGFERNFQAVLPPNLHAPEILENIYPIEIVIPTDHPSSLVLINHPKAHVLFYCNTMLDENRAPYTAVTVQPWSDWPDGTSGFFNDIKTRLESAVLEMTDIHGRPFTPKENHAYLVPVEFVLE